MKVITFCCSILLGLQGFGGTIVLEGSYQNKNVYVQNDISGLGVGYCTIEVSVNGHVSTDEINSSAFEIDLTQYQLRTGQPVVITIKYKDDGCSPKVINPFVIQPVPTFECQSIYVSRDGKLQWTASNEKTILPYIVEQYKWNKWVKIGEVECIGGSGTNSYEFNTTPIPGVNKFRIKQKGYMGKSRYSPTCSYTSFKSEVGYIYNHKIQTIQFSESIDYEVYDRYGNIVKKGHGKQFGVANLEKNKEYYMNYSNSMDAFKVRSR